MTTRQMADSHVILKVPAADMPLCQMNLITIHCDFNFDPPLDGKVVRYSKLDGAATGYFDGTISNPIFEGAAIVCYGQNIKHCGQMAWATVTGPAYAKCAALEGVVNADAE